MDGWVIGQGDGWLVFKILGPRPGLNPGWVRAKEECAHVENNQQCSSACWTDKLVGGKEFKSRYYYVKVMTHIHKKHILGPAQVCSDMIGQHLSNYKWKPEHFRYQNLCPLPTDIEAQSVYRGYVTSDLDCFQLNTQIQSQTAVFLPNSLVALFPGIL